MKDIGFLSDFILKRVDKRLDTITAVDSGAVKGTGKTVFTVDTSKDLCSKINSIWNLQKMMVLNATSQMLMDSIKHLPFGTPIPVDEAIFIAYKRDYGEDPNKDLVKFLNICRKFRKPVFLNTPSFWDLDKDIRNLCDFRATIIKRGIASIRGKYSNPEYEDLWLREESKKIIDKEISSDFTDLGAVIRGMGKCRNHLFDIVFPDMPENEYNDYEKLSMREEGKQLYLDEKRIYVLIKILSYIVSEECYFKTPLGTYSKISYSALTKEVNNHIANSKYAQEFSKFRTATALWEDYKREWKQAIGGGGLSHENNNNIKITSTDKEEKAPEEQQDASLAEAVA